MYSPVKKTAGNPCRPQHFWSANKEVIANRWPDLLAPLLAAAPNLPQHELVEERTQTLSIDGLQLTSKYDRHAEATLQASIVPLDSDRAWVYGIALGDVPRVLLKRPNLQQLTLFILNPAVAYLSLMHFDHCDWLTDPRVTLVLPDADQPLQKPFAAAPACLLLADRQAAALRDRVFLELATPFIGQKHQASPELIQRLEQNAALVARDRDVSELFGTKSGETLVVAAAGPTLSDQYHWLVAHDRPPLIAVDAALKPLLKAGIVPEYVVIIDSHPELFHLLFSDLDPTLLNRTALIYFPVVATEVLENWPGPRYASYPRNPLYRELAEHFPRTELFSSGTVLHPAVDLAVRMGGSNIILAGADLSYPDGKTHVAGCSLRRAPSGMGRHWVTNGCGQPVATTPNMRGYLRDLEDYLGQQKHVAFVNSSDKGAAIRHAPYKENLP